MAISVISAKQFQTNLKATIQKTGRLGFTDDTAKVLDLGSGKFVKFAQDDEKGILYLIIIDKGSEDAFPVKFSGGYYSVHSKQMFDMLGYDYEKYNIMFDLIRQNSLDADLQGLVYKMKPRINKRKEKQDEDIV